MKRTLLPSEKGDKPRSQKSKKSLSRMGMLAAVVVLVVVVSGLTLGLVLVHHGNNGAAPVANRAATTAPTSSLGIYVNSGKGVSKLDARTGALIWSYQQAAGALSSPPVVVNGAVYFRPQNDAIYALNAADGALRWRVQLPGGNVSSMPAVAGGMVYVGGAFDYNLYALNVNDGSVRWHVPTSAGLASSPAVANGIVYVSAVAEQSALYAFDAQTGTLLWSAQPLPEQHFTTPQAADGVVYIDSIANSQHTSPEPTDAYVYAFNGQTGTLLWHSQKLDSGNFSLSTPAIVDGVVSVGAGDGYLYALNATTGALLWRHNSGSPLAPSLLASGGVVYMDETDGNGRVNLIALSLTDGSLRWQSAAAGTPLAVQNGILYIGSSDPSGQSTVFGLDITDGAQMWQSRMQTQTNFSPSIPGGSITTFAP